MSALFENAIDSLHEGLRIYVDGTGGTAPKHAIRNIFHAVELLLKERLSREHPLFIYRNLERAVSDESQTVGLDETLARFHNLNIRLSSNDISTLKDLRKRRNRIEHHSFQQDQNHVLVVGKALRFIYHFLKDHLGTTLEDVLDEELFPRAREAILGFEAVLKEAEEEVAARTTAKTKDDLETLPTGVVPRFLWKLADVASGCGFTA